ncbi:MAG TPA: hypothetical protein VKA08_00190 [Balneolales bacterium]|nr:hypothetical protein [Balneolales bacterium]
MKYTFILFLFFFLYGCSTNKKTDLQQDPIVTAYFNKNEIKQLDQVLSFFDDEVRLLSNTSSPLENSYQVFFKIESDSAWAGDPYGPILKIPAKKLNNLFSSISENLKNKLWVTSHYISPMTKDSVTDFNIRSDGKYEAFLQSSANENQTLANYYKTFKQGHGITPALIAGFVMHANKLDLQRQSQRLIVAIHYIAIRETGQLRWEAFEKSRKKVASSGRMRTGAASDSVKN